MKKYVLFLIISTLTLSNLFSQNKFEYFNTLNSQLPNDYVTNILIDKSENIWFATYGGGVVKKNESNWKIFTRKNNLCSDTVVHIFEDSKGNIWFSGYNNGISYISNDSIKTFHAKDGYTANNAFSIAEDKQKNIWIGTDNGLFKFNGITFTRYSTIDGIASNKVFSLSCDDNGILWIGTESGLNSFNGTIFNLFTKSNGLIDNDINYVYIDNNQNIYIATWLGVSIFNGVSKWTNVTSANGLSEDWVWSIYQDYDGCYWFGHDLTGISKSCSDNFKYFTTQSGLSDYSIFDIAQDKDSNYWIATMLGVTKLTLDKNSGFEQIGLKNGIAYINNNSLIIQNLSNNLLNIYNSNGALIQSIDIKNDIQSIELMNKGIFIVVAINRITGISNHFLLINN